MEAAVFVNDPRVQSLQSTPFAQPEQSVAMSKSIEGVSNWMHMFRWIVKLIRDEYGVDEALLTRNATLETDIQLSIDQVEQVLEYISESFGIRFPEGTLDELVKLEELRLLASWIKGYYKRPEFISDEFEGRCRGINEIAA